MRLPPLALLVATLLAAPLVAPLSAVAAENWPQWRGPDGTGVVKNSGTPFYWSESRNLRWKCPLPEWGTSTPAVWGEAIFVTSHAEERLLLLRIDRKSGQIVWTREVGRGTTPREAEKRSTQKFHALHNLASPSPATDGRRVVVHFGNGDLAAYDFDGRELWKRNLQQDHGLYTIWWGHANTPVLVGDLVISACMQDNLSDLRDKPVESYLVAHGADDGQLRWKTPRMTGAPGEQADSYTTPLLLEVDGSQQLVVMGGNQLDAYDPATGRQIWHLSNLVGGRTVTGPTAAHGLVYATRGMRGPILAVRPGRGELTTRDIVWQHDEGSPDSCSPVVWDRHLYTVTDDGIVRCLDALTGHLRYKQRIPGKYKASPLAIDGRIIFLNTEGLATVIAATDRFEKLTENQLPDETLASPAVAGGRIYLRGRTALWSIGEPDPPREE